MVIHDCGKQVSWLAAAVLLLTLARPAIAVDSYDSASRHLTIPTLVIGEATYSNVVVTVGNIVNYPTGTSTIAVRDTYNPSTGLLTVPAVVVGSDTFYNVVVTIARLDSIGSVSGADTLSGSTLTIPSVQVDGGAIYTNVVILVGNVVNLLSGMPASGMDQYDSTKGQLTIASIQLGGKVYTNAVITVAHIVSVGGYPENSWSFSTLYGFDAPGSVMDGTLPLAGLTFGADGALYGTTTQSGANGDGTIFRIGTNGGETTFVPFPGPVGDYPQKSALILASDGNFYGTAQDGGTNGQGIVFSVSPAGTFTTLYSFSQVSTQTGTLGENGDGAAPRGRLVEGPDGNFYGTAYVGGASGDGTLFRLSRDGTFTTLHSFNGADGQAPVGGLTVGTDGNLYGTTVLGGDNGTGTFFRTSPSGSFALLYSFSGDFYADAGRQPTGDLVLGSDGNFYGTATSGGQYGSGTVFRITPAGVPTTLHTFTSSDGYQPLAGLLLGRDGY